MFKPLSNSAIIGVTSPAWIPVRDRLASGVQYLQGKGYTIRTGDNINKTYGYFAGTESERLDDLHDLYTAPDVEMIICTRGGWGGLRMVNRLSYQIVSENPKPLVGYSDITTLHLAIYKMAGIPSLSGPMVAVEMAKGIHPFTEKHFWGQVYNKERQYVFNYSETGAKTMLAGKAEGILLGGCLSMVAGLLGTPFCPDYTDKILFIEDVGEKPYKIDRYLAQLMQAGVLAGIKGLILGDFIDCEAEKDETSFTIAQLIDHYFSDAKYPVIYNFPYGHGEVKFTMPIGMNVKLETKKETLTLDNPFFGNKYANLLDI